MSVSALRRSMRDVFQTFTPATSHAGHAAVDEPGECSPSHSSVSSSSRHKRGRRPGAKEPRTDVESASDSDGGSQTESDSENATDHAYVDAKPRRTLSLGNAPARLHQPPDVSLVELRQALDAAKTRLSSLEAENVALRAAFESVAASTIDTRASDKQEMARLIKSRRILERKNKRLVAAIKNMATKNLQRIAVKDRLIQSYGKQIAVMQSDNEELASVLHAVTANCVRQMTLSQENLKARSSSARHFWGTFKTATSSAVFGTTTTWSAKNHIAHCRSPREAAASIATDSTSPASTRVSSPPNTAHPRDLLSGRVRPLDTQDDKSSPIANFAAKKRAPVKRKSRRRAPLVLARRTRPLSETAHAAYGGLDRQRATFPARAVAPAATEKPTHVYFV